jgi:hypothetical protein
MSAAMRALLVAIIGVVAVACGGRSALEAPSSSAGGAHAAGSSGASGAVGEVGSSSVGAGGGDAGEPVPTCTGSVSQCVMNAQGVWTGAAIIKCDGVYFVGPWTLLLERQIANQFQVVQVQVVEEPGFGATFDDSSGPAMELTYRVCVVGNQGTQCGASFTTFGPPDCVCQPATCEQYRACFTSFDDGCGSLTHCGACPDDGACNHGLGTCCPPGQESDGQGGCECAPLTPCGPKAYWNPGLCVCATQGTG